MISHESDYSVTLTSQQLGLTIENVLERTVVRNVLDGSEAKKKGVKNNSLVVSVGMTNCLTQTHAETLDSMKRSTRPVKIAFRMLDGALLNQRRAEMQGFLQKKRDKSTLDSSYYDTTVKSIEKRTKWLLRMFALALCLPQNTPAQLFTPDVDSGDVSLVSCTPGTSSWTEKAEKSGSSSTSRTSTERRFIEKKVEPTLELLLGMEKQCYMNNRADVLPYMRLTTTLDYLAIFYCELDDSVHTPPQVLMVLESAITDICFSLLQLEANAVPGNENLADSALPNEAPHNLLHLIIAKFDNDKLRTHAIPMLWRLGTSNAMSSRLTCCNLIPVIYNKLPFCLQLQLRGLLTRLLGDSADTIRIQVLECICTRLGNKADMQWVLYCISVAAADASALVRGAVFELCVLALQSTSEAQPAATATTSREEGSTPAQQRTNTDAHLVFCRLHPIINKLTEDADPAVKTLVAAKCDLLCKYMGLHWSAVITDILLAMLQDSDDTVRATAVATAPRLVVNMVSLFNKKHPLLNRAGSWRTKLSTPGSPSVLSRRVNAAWGGREQGADEGGPTPEPLVTAEATPLTLETVALLNRIRDNVMPPMLRLRRDQCKEVRVALASAIPEMLSAVCRVQVEDTTQGGVTSTVNSRNSKIGVAKVLVAVILELLSDNDTENGMEIAYAVLQQVLVSDLSNISSFIFTASNCSLLINCVTPLATNNNWRMRKAVCSAVPLIVSACKTVETRVQTAAMVVPLLKDEIFEVRRCAAAAMCLAASCDVDSGRNAGAGGSTVSESRGSIVSPRLSMATIMSVTGQRRGAGAAALLDGVPSEDVTDGEFSEEMGRMWLDSIVLPNLEDFCTSPRFQERILALHMVTVLLSERIVDVTDSRWELLLRMSLSMTSDRIVNVRIGVATVLLNLIPVMIARQEADSEAMDGPSTIVPGQAAVAQRMPWVADVHDSVLLAAADKDRDVASLGNQILSRSGVLFQ